MFNHAYRVNVQEIFEDQKMILCSGYSEFPDFKFSADPITIHEITFPSKKDFEEFRLNSSEKSLNEKIKTLVSQKKINSATKIEVLNQNGQIQTPGHLLAFTDMSLKYFSKLTKRQFEFKLDQTIYAEISHPDGKQTLIFKERDFAFEKQYNLETYTTGNAGTKIFKNVRVRNKTLVESYKQFKEGNDNTEVKPLILRLSPDPVISADENDTDDPFC